MPLHARADETIPNLRSAGGDVKAMGRLLGQYCFECHGADTQEAAVRLDSLDLATEHRGSSKMLERVLVALSTKKMPPEEAEVPTADERSFLVSWIQRRLTRLAVAARRTGRWTRNRRLTTEEYDFTMQTLFGVDAEFADMLTADPVSEAGYRNDSERLGLSSLQIESYLDSARRAVERYVEFGETEQQPLRYQIEFEDLFYSTADRYETRKRGPAPVDSRAFAARRQANLSSEPKFIDPLGPRLPGAFSDDEQLRAAIPKLNQQYVAIPRRLAVGEMIVRVRCAGTADRNGRFPRMRVEAGITLGDGCSMNKRVLGEVDVTASISDPQTYEFRMRLEDVPTKGPLRDEDSFDRLSVFDMDQVFISNISCDRKAIFAKGRGGYSDPTSGSKRIADDLKQMADDGVNFLLLDCLEIELLPAVDAANRRYRWQVPTTSANEELMVARRFLAEFMQHAFRRPVADSEIAAKLQLLSTLRDREYTFEESLRETLAAVLVSPSFLFLESNPPADVAEQTETATAHQLAARLSYLLWLSPPDERLMERADDGSITRPSVLRSEALRLLSDPRCDQFLESFCRQWLRLDKHANIAVDRRVHPTWDDDLAAISIRETLAYFVEVFRSDVSALDLIDSNYTMMNDRLAEHYDVRNVTDGHLHKIQLPHDSIRGGLLTQASLLTMNSDGVDSHPIRRGVWLLDRLLNSPPPPPPPNVPEIDSDDPDFRGLSLIERIKLHRQPGSCSTCHEKIDPWGIPFESFDATGRYRDHIEIREDKKSQFRPVDSAATLPDGQQISDITELKKYVREQQGDKFANALVHHMVTYAIGRPPDFVDRPDVKEIEDRFLASGLRLRELVLAMIESEIFRQAN
jgi:hypothetical protein